VYLDIRKGQHVPLSTSLASINVISLGAIRVIASILAAFDSDYVGVWMLTSFNLGNYIPTWHVFALSNIVMFVSAVWTVVSASYVTHRISTL